MEMFKMYHHKVINVRLIWNIFHLQEKLRYNNKQSHELI
jgi:hypothetical protein